MDKLLIICSLLAIGVGSCKEKLELKPAEPIEKDIYYFEFNRTPTGDSIYNFCGDIIFAVDSSFTKASYFKANNLPSVFKYSSSAKYRGRFKIYPTYHECADGMVDPVPGHGFPIITYRYVDILEWSYR